MKYLACLWLLLAPWVSQAQSSRYESPRTGNPIIPGYFADPSIEQIGDTFYLYSTTVSDYFEPVVWKSVDLTHWEVQPLGITGEHRFWAPCLLPGEDGKYYLYYSSGFDFRCYLYVGETPSGPFEKYGQVEQGFDLEIFQDPVSGRVYGCSSNPASRPRLVEFDSDSDSPGYLKEVVREIGELPGAFFDYSEGSMLLYRDGWYYLMYSGGKCGEVTYNIRYARSRQIEGPYQTAPQNPILRYDPAQEIYGPGHHSVLTLDGDYFIFYHRQDKWEAPTCSERQVCVDRMRFDKEGWIEPIAPSHPGVDFSLYFPDQPGSAPNLALGKPVTASASRPEHEPWDAVDGNYGTYWSGGGSLTVDLEDVYELSHIRPWFRYYDSFILYRIEYSLDNQQWETYLDRTLVARKGYAPMPRREVRARYVRITFLRGEGDFAALYELEVRG